jgi:hypothetical protein
MTLYTRAYERCANTSDCTTEIKSSLCASKGKVIAVMATTT